MAKSCPTLGVLHYEAGQFQRKVTTTFTKSPEMSDAWNTPDQNCFCLDGVCLLQDRRWQAVGQTVHRGNHA